MYSFITITYNEQDKIKNVIKSIENAAKGYDYEIVVSDGGSKDKTLNIVEAENVKLVNSKPGRGVQLVSGVNASAGDILIFLHGDTFFPENGLQLIEESFKKGIKAATFRMKFDEDKCLYNLYGWFTKFDSVFSSFGDQCIVVDREIYTRTGGFPEWQIFEDVEFLRKVRKETKIKSLPGYVITSARRFEKNGIVKQQLLNFFMIIGFYLGIDHLRLKEIYAGKKRCKKKSAVVLFTKMPEKGKVKTRLAEKIGNQNAVDFYKVCCENCFEKIREIKSVSKYVFINENENSSEVQNWIGNEFNIEVQAGKDLGEKLFNACIDIFSKKYDKIVILGTDIPDISSDIIQKAFTALDESDFVIGPSDDGGYYLIGMNQLNKEIFENINWSTEKVLEQTIKKIKNGRYTYTTLTRLKDIDYLEDLENWSETNKNDMHPVQIWYKNMEITYEKD